MTNDLPKRLPKQIAHGKVLPDWRVVTATSLLLHSSDKSTKNARTVLETVEGEDIFSQNISARAHIVVSPRKPRACKIATAKPTANKKATVRTSKKQVEEIGCRRGGGRGGNFSRCN